MESLQIELQSKLQELQEKTATIEEQQQTFRHELDEFRQSLFKVVQDLSSLAPPKVDSHTYHRPAPAKPIEHKAAPIKTERPRGSATKPTESKPTATKAPTPTSEDSLPSKGRGQDNPERPAKAAHVVGNRLQVAQEEEQRKVAARGIRIYFRLKQSHLEECLKLRGPSPPEQELLDVMAQVLSPEKAKTQWPPGETAEQLYESFKNIKGEFPKASAQRILQFARRRDINLQVYKKSKEDIQFIYRWIEAVDQFLQVKRSNPAIAAEAYEKAELIAKQMDTAKPDEEVEGQTTEVAEN